MTGGKPATGGWAGAGQRVRALAAAPRAGSVFGAVGNHGHRFHLRPAAREAEVATFERAVGVRLPEDYREFLTEVSGGGAGPHYGLTPLPAGPMDGQLLERLAAPFRPDVVQPLLDAHAREEPRRCAYTDEDAYWKAQRAWMARLEELQEPLLDGTLTLSDQGCGYEDVLVLNGPERGNVWEDLIAADQGVHPLGNGDEERVTFTDWYLGWLDRTERKVFGTA